MRNTLIAIGIFGAIMSIAATWRGTNIAEGQSSTQQSAMIKNTVVAYSGILIMVMAAIGILTIDKK